MPCYDPFSFGTAGAVLALGGLVTLMTSDSPNPRSLAAASACLVGALFAFALSALRRDRPRAATDKSPPATAAPAPAAALSSTELAALAQARLAARLAAQLDAGSAIRSPAPAPAPAEPPAATPHPAMFAPVQIRRSG
ncbi:hypothetical protein [Methylobacterium symbioticum]|uniref:Uncharacterized protein n=1 Tax=Methylobacterium symbioticum TaxID=2584084 RepID=A0A509ELV5_9HYPH|nr:hypothetical protein [Methylobacterium symbioticum]VUD74395.1 hypothetical protein MET9862_05024 [Methylobacterium symbioticum]